MKDIKNKPALNWLELEPKTQGWAYTSVWTVPVTKVHLDQEGQLAFVHFFSTGENGFQQASPTGS